MNVSVAIQADDLLSMKRTETSLGEDGEAQFRCGDISVNAYLTASDLVQIASHLQFLAGELDHEVEQLAGVES